MRNIGLVLEALERNGLAENTLIICTTDHGIAFPGMKCHLTDRGIGVLLILRGPQIPTGKVCDALVSQIDIFPTLCEYARHRKTELAARAIVVASYSTARRKP